MNWYKKSGIEDFYSGVIKDKLHEFSKNESELTEDQIDYIKHLSLSDMYVMDHTELFRLYPRYIYYSMYYLEQYIKYKYGIGTWNSDIEQIFALTKKYHPDHYPISYMNSRYYEDIMNDPEGWKINEKFASHVFEYEKIMPVDFINWFIQKYPEIYESKNSSTEEKLQIIKNFLTMGTSHDYVMLETMSSSLYTSYESSQEEKDIKRRERDEFVGSIYNPLLDYEEKLSYISRILNRKKKDIDQNYFSGKGEEIVLEIEKIAESYKSGQDFFSNDSFFSIFFIDLGPPIGTIRLLFFITNKIRYEDLEKIHTICFHKSKDYFRVEYNDNEQIVLIEEAEEEKITPIGDSVWIDRYYDSKKSQIQAIDRYFSPSNYNEEYLYWNWFNSKLTIAKQTGKEYQFMFQISNSDKFVEILEAASSILGSLYICNNTLIEREDYNPSKNYNFSDQFPFILSLANKIMDVMPINIKVKIMERHIATWYLLCSGKFPCKSVYENAIRHPIDTIKIIDHISCLGGESENIKEQIRIKASELKREAKETVIDRFEEFASNSENCKVANIKDFPGLYDYVIELVGTHIDSREKSWSHEAGKSITLPEIVLSRIEKSVIYIVNSEQIVSFFGKEALVLAGLSPSESKGVFCPKYSLSENHDSIIVFSETGTDSRQISLIINDILGLTPDPSKGDKLSNVSDENTLWHEVTHSVFSSLVYGEEAKTLSKWLRSPSEIIAIQYGNLQHIKKKLRSFFENNIPTSSKVEAGLLAHIEAEIIETFSWEFYGMNKEEALTTVRENIEDFREEVAASRGSMTKEESVTLLTDIFLEFFMGKMLRGKAEDEINAISEALGQKDKKITFKEEVVIPETYEYRSPGQKDDVITSLENRIDYQTFIVNVKKRVEEYKTKKDFYGQERIKFYLHRNDKSTFREPREFSDLIALIFEPPSSLLEVDVSKNNHLFDDLVPPSLKHDVIDIIETKRESLNVPIEEKDQPVSPEEAEETGKFMTEMDREYSPDWVWTAKTDNWYKKAISNKE